LDQTQQTLGSTLLVERTGLLVERTGLLVERTGLLVERTALLAKQLLLTGWAGIDDRAKTSRLNETL
jgi:hypothetical protein